MGIGAELQGKYDEGFAAGEAVGFVKGQESIILPDPANPDKKYSQLDMDNLREQVRGEKDAEYAPQLAAKDETIASQADEIEVLKAENASLKAEMDARVVAGALERVSAVKAAAKAELDEAEAAIENL